MEKRSTNRLVNLAITACLLATLTLQPTARPAAQGYTEDISGENYWSWRGPQFNTANLEAPHVIQIVSDPVNHNIVYAATSQGVYRSTDFGESWEPRNRGLGGYGDLVVSGLAIDPITPTRLVIGTWGYGLFVSTDSGALWTRLADPLQPASTLTEIPADAAGPLPLLAAGGPSYMNGAPRPAETPPGKMIHPSAAYLPEKMTSDAPQAIADLPINLSWTPVRRVSLNPANPNEIYACIDNGYGLYQSLNGGASWTHLEFQTGTARTFTFAPSNPQIRYASFGSWAPPGAGLYRTLNGGASWIPVGIGTILGTVISLAIHPTNPNVVVAGTAYDGLYRSINGGDSWVKVSDSLADDTYYSVAFSQSNPNVVYAGGNLWIYESFDAGGTWGNADSSFPTYYVEGLAVHRSAWNVVLAGANQFPNGGVYKRTDWSSPFGLRAAGMTDTFVFDIEQDPIFPNVLYAATWGAGVFRSDDGGATWQRKDGVPEYIYALEAVRGFNRTVLYATTFYSDYGIYKSYDRGDTWIESSNSYLSDISFDILAHDDGMIDLTSLAPNAGTGSFLYRDQVAIDTPANNGDRVASPQAYRWTSLNPDAPTVLVYVDDSYHTAPGTFVDQVLQELGLSYTAHYSGDFSGFENDLTSTAWDLVIFANDAYTPPLSTLGMLDNYVQNRGRLLIHTWTLESTYDHSLWEHLGVIWTGNDTNPPDSVYWWAPEHQFFTDPEVVPQLTPGGGAAYGVYGHTLQPRPGFEALAGYTAAPAQNAAALIYGNQGRTVFKGFLDGQHTQDSDSDGRVDGLELWRNLVLHILEDSNPILAATVGGVQISYDGAHSWQDVEGLDAGVTLKLCQFPDGNLLTATYGGGVYHSYDGAEWHEANTGFVGTYRGYIFDVDCSRWTSGLAYAAGLGLYRTLDYGEHWERINTGLPAPLDYYRAVEIDPGGSDVFAGGLNNGVFKSKNGVSSWMAINTGLGEQRIRSLSVLAGSPLRVFAGTNGKGAWDYTVNVTSGPIIYNFLPLIKRQGGPVSGALAVEPNDSISTASVIPGSGVYSGFIGEGDEDWFAVYLGNTAVLTAGLTHIPGGRDYDLQLFAADSSLLGSSYWWGNLPEEIIFQAAQAGWYYLRVYSNYGSSLDLPYWLTVNIGASSGAGAISGAVTHSGAPAAGVGVRILYDNGYQSKSIYTATDASGWYTFRGLATLPVGHSYHIQYPNFEGRPDRLWFWRCNSITAYTQGANLAGCSFDTGDVALTAPTSGAILTLPGTFTWNRRTPTTDSYRLSLWDSQRGVNWVGPELGYIGSYTLSHQVSGFLSGVGHRWEVIVSDTGGSGLSFGYPQFYFNFAPLQLGAPQIHLHGAREPAELFMLLLQTTSQP